MCGVKGTGLCVRFKGGTGLCVRFKGTGNM